MELLSSSAECTLFDSLIQHQKIVLDKDTILINLTILTTGKLANLFFPYNET